MATLAEPLAPRRFSSSTIAIAPARCVTSDRAVVASRISLWLTALVLGALLSGCSASRPLVCRPGGDPSRDVPAVAGHVLLGVAEVLVGTELRDHTRDDRRSACTDVAEKDRADRVAALPTPASDPRSTSVVAAAREQVAAARDRATAARERISAARERPAVAPQKSHTAPPAPAALPAMKPEAVEVRPGRWILIRKSDHTLSVFDADHRVKTYAVVLGADPVDPKLYEGDRRTPEGEYHVIAKHVHPEWQRFLLLDYPNADDRQVYIWRRTKGLVPARGGQVAGTGGAIGIHGTVNDALNRAGVNWTYGCISLLSRDMRELYDIVPVGTRVVIEH
jgi:lipoprotein-anchoring transpeptidase ErfK/SrfK